MQFVETLLPFLLNERYGFAFFPRHRQSIETQHQFRVQTNVGKGVGDHGLIEVTRKVENESTAFLVLKSPVPDILEKMLVRLIVREQPCMDFVLALGEYQ